MLCNLKLLVLLTLPLAQTLQVLAEAVGRGGTVAERRRLQAPVLIFPLLHAARGVTDVLVYKQRVSEV